jgi:hypothetical protein
VPEATRAIASLNRSELNVNTRRELVTLFDNTYAQIFASYRPQASHLLDNESYRKEHDSLHAFTREMAFAHKIIADGELNKRRLFGKNKDLVKAINLALHYLGLLLMEHYESYSPIPVYLWRECNGLYAYAQEKQIEDVNVFPEGYHQCMPSIELTFARTCLMSLADPYHLSKGEHWQVFKYLESWGHLADFSDDTDDFTDSQCFVIRTQSQMKPEYSALYKGDLEEDNVCFMLTNDLIRQISYHLDSMAGSNETPDGFYVGLRPATVRALLEHMTAHWNAKIERKGRRYPVLTKLDILWGVHPTHTLLQQHLKSPESTHWDTETIQKFIANEHQTPLAWDATNVSDGGIGISTQKNIAYRLKVGDLVIIREYIDKKPSFRWRPAICRWLYGNNNQGTNAGLEFLEGALSPCRLNNKLAASKTSLGQAALMYTPPPSRKELPVSLLAIRGTYRDGRDFLLRYEGHLEDIKARRRTMVTPCIEVFEYQTYEVTEVDEEQLADKIDTIPWTEIPNEGKIKEASDDENIDLDSVRLPGDH